VIHGPRPKRWRERVPHQVRSAAFVSALSERARRGLVRVVELGAFEEPGTARLARAIDRWDAEGKVLLLIREADRNILLSGRNLARVTVKKFSDASAHDVLIHDVVAVEDGAWDTRSSPMKSRAEEGRDDG
jgi:large subunit ribosomal protein L4